MQGPTILFVRHGFHLTGITCFKLEQDSKLEQDPITARVTPEAVVPQTMAPDAEARFVSCTVLRAAEVAERIEVAIGRPVVTRNQASVRHCLRHVGIDRLLVGHGRLLRLPMEDGAWPKA